jgi:hypothetical protein
MKKTQKNEGLFAFLTSILKRSADAPEDENVIISGMRILAEEVKQLTTALSLLATSVQKHNESIADLYEVQEVILKHINASKRSDVTVSLSGKNKPQKPN